MKKVFIALCAMCFVALQASAQQNAFSKEKPNVLNFGIGFGNGYHASFGGLGNASDNRTSWPTFSASYERCAIDKLFNDKSSLGFGGIFAFGRDAWENNNNKASVNYITIQGRGVFHYALVDKLDTYAGLGLGYTILAYSDEFDGYNDKSGSRFSESFFIGARYYFADNFGAFAELGWGTSFATIGLTYKF